MYNSGSFHLLYIEAFARSKSYVWNLPFDCGIIELRDCKMLFSCVLLMLRYKSEYTLKIARYAKGRKEDYCGSFRR